MVQALLGHDQVGYDREVVLLRGVWLDRVQHKTESKWLSVPTC